MFIITSTAIYLFISTAIYLFHLFINCLLLSPPGELVYAVFDLHVLYICFTPNAIVSIVLLQYRKCRVMTTTVYVIREQQRRWSVRAFIQPD